MVTARGFANLEEIDGFFRDFLIQLAEFGGGDDNKALYHDDKEAAKKAMAAAQNEIRAQIPGALNPHDIEDDDDL